MFRCCGKVSWSGWYIVVFSMFMFVILADYVWRLMSLCFRILDILYIDRVIVFSVRDIVTFFLLNCSTFCVDIFILRCCFVDDNVELCLFIVWGLVILCFNLCLLPFVGLLVCSIDYVWDSCIHVLCLFDVGIVR